MPVPTPRMKPTTPPARPRLRPLLAALLLCGGTPALAQEISDADLMRLASLSLDELIHLPVTTASRQTETRDRTPAHILVITRQQIRERRYKNLADLIEDLPGVDFQRGTKSSQYNQFAVQGYVGPNKLLVMLDGVRIDKPTGGNYPVAENLALYHARQVEVLYGPAAALYGADAVAGVINIVTEPARRGSDTWLSLGAGNFASHEASFMGGTATASGLAWQVGGHWQASDRAPLDRHYPVDFQKVSAAGIAAADREDYVGDIASHSLFARLDYHDRFSLGFHQSQFNSLTSTGDPPSTAIFDPNSEWITRIDSLYGKLRFEAGARLRGELVADYSRLEVDPRAKYKNWYNGYTDGYSYVFGERFAIEQNLDWRLNERHHLLGGLGYQKYYAIEAASLPGRYDTGKGLYGQGYLYPNTPLPYQIHDASFDNISLYGQLKSEWSEAFSTMAGLRLDRHSDYGQTVNPRLGGIWRVNPRHVLKALYGESFRAPSPEEYLSFFGSFDGSTDAGGLYIGRNFRVPNFSLAPEKAKTLSLTWDWRLRPNVNLVANLYHSRIDKLIVTRPGPARDTSTIPGAVLLNPETKGNAGHQSQHGLDLATQWHFVASDDWRGELWASYSHVRGRIDEGDGVEWDIPHVAAHKARLGATLRYRDRFTLTPRLLWTGDTTHGRKRPPAAAVQIPADCTQAMVAPKRCETDGYFVANLHMGWHKLLDGHASLWLDVYNLFDTRYHAAHGSASRTFWDMPQQPRSWMLSLEYRF